MSHNHFAWDIGAIEQKAIYAGQVIHLISLVSICSNTRLAKTTGLNLSSSNYQIELDTGKVFFVGKNAHMAGRPIENFGMERFSGCPELKALLYGVFTKAIEKNGEIDSPINVVVGLPIELLRGEQAQKNIADTKRWIKAEHKWLANGKEYRVCVDDVKATSQPAGGYFDYILNEKGQILPEKQFALTNEIGIISIGMNTVELMSIRDKTVMERFTSGSTSGVRRLLELVNTDQSYSTGELDNLLRSNALDISHALPLWEREVTGVIEKCWGRSWKRFAAVLIMGGGAILLRNSLPYYFMGKAIIPDDPVMSIARGLYKLGLYQNKAKNG